MGVTNTGSASDALFDETAHTAGVGIVQHIDSAAMELYLSYRPYWANDITDVQVDTATGGALDVPSDLDMSRNLWMVAAVALFRPPVTA